ncbi:MAG: AAA family ATPase [Planctomycetes bacterium]|nr:AAA family ATPase [Planctomycetota bacterium]
MTENNDAPHLLQPSRKQPETDVRDRMDDLRLKLMRMSNWELLREYRSNELARKNVTTAKRSAHDRLRAVDASESIGAAEALRVGWLWPGRIPMRKVSLITGETGDGKSLVVADFIARVSTGRPIPDGSMDQIEAPVYDPGNILHIGPASDARDVVAPRLLAAGADLTHVRFLTSVAWTDGQTGERRSDSFTLPNDGLLLERIIEREQPRLVVIDPLSEVLRLPQKPGLRETALHDVLGDLESLAEECRIAIVCVESDRPGGLVDTGSDGRRRANYDSAFKTVWGVVRDPRDRSRRLFVPVRHHLGDDRAGLRFAVAANKHDVACIEWNRHDESLTYAEATGRLRVAGNLWNSTKTAQAEVWLKEYLAYGEKPSTEIFRDALEQGFTEFPVRTALRRIAVKSKQGKTGPWFWQLDEDRQKIEFPAKRRR